MFVLSTVLITETDSGPLNGRNFTVNVTLQVASIETHTVSLTGGVPYTAQLFQRAYGAIFVYVGFLSSPR